MNLSKCNGNARKNEYDTVCCVSCSNCVFNIYNHFESMSAAMLNLEVLCEREKDKQS